MASKGLQALLMQAMHHGDARRYSRLKSVSDRLTGSGCKNWRMLPRCAGAADAGLCRLALRSSLRLPDSRLLPALFPAPILLA